jgi:hypothetical protein
MLSDFSEVQVRLNMKHECAAPMCLVMRKESHLRCKICYNNFMKQSSGWKVLPNNIIEACQIETTKMVSAGVSRLAPDRTCHCTRFESLRE